MKNIIKSILLSAAAITLTASCAQENFSAPKGGSLTFTGTIADATRTSLDADGTVGKVNWVAGDEITINGVAYVATPDAGDATKATFTKKNEADADPEAVYGTYYATYCCSFDAELGEGVIPATQPYTTSSLAAPMYAESETTSLSFCNICGLLEITLKGTGSIKGIEVSSSDYGMSGAFAIYDSQSATVIDAANNPVSLDCGEGIAMTSEGTKFYVAVPAGDYTGLKIAVSTTDGGTWSKTAVNTASVEANTIYPLVFTPEFSAGTARYSNDGGKTWSYTLGLEEAVKGIASTTMKEDGIVELLKDYTLNEQIKTEGVKFTLNGNGHTLTVPLIKSGKDTVFGAIYPVASSDVTITGITIQSSSSRGSAVRTEGSTVTLGKDCLIKGFSTYKNGGALWGDPASTIYMTENSRITDCHCENPTYGGGAICSDGKVYIGDDAVISGCSTTKKDGGAVLVNSTKAKLTLYGNALIENCTAATSGGAIRGTNSAVIEIKDNAHITGCKALNGSGGAICDNYTGASMTISGNVVIDKCTATNLGGAFYHSGTFTVKGNVKIEGCSAKFGGGFAMWRNGTVDENALIKDCTAERGGAVYDTTGTAANYGVLDFKGNAKITGCSTTSNFGGGIYATKNCTCKLSGYAKIESCAAKTYGGGIYTLGTCSLTGDANVCGCSATWGGGIFVANNTTDISGNVNIYDNTAATNGCAVCSGGAGAIVNISGGKFSANSAKAVLANSNKDAKLYVTGGWFLQNGTGDYLYRYSSSATFSITGGYYGPTFTTGLLASGYSIKDNLQMTAEDMAAFAAGCTKKVIKD